MTAESQFPSTGPDETTQRVIKAAQKLNSRFTSFMEENQRNRQSQISIQQQIPQDEEHSVEIERQQRHQPAPRPSPHRNPPFEEDLNFQKKKKKPGKLTLNDDVDNFNLPSQREENYNSNPRVVSNDQGQQIGTQSADYERDSEGGPNENEPERSV